MTAFGAGIAGRIRSDMNPTGVRGAAAAFGAGSLSDMKPTRRSSLRDAVGGGALDWAPAPRKLWGEVGGRLLGAAEDDVFSGCFCGELSKLRRIYRPAKIG